MQHLIFKDIYTQKWYAYVGIIFWIILFTGFFTDGSPLRHVMLLVALATWFAYASNGNTKSFEQELTLLISLPVKRNKIVLAKYVTSFVWFVYSLIIVVAYIYLYEQFAPFPTRMLNVSEILVSFGMYLIILAVFYPVLFRVGYQTATIVLGFVLGIVFMSMQIGINMLENPRFVEFHQFVGKLSTQEMIVAAVSVVIGLLFLIVSQLISVKFFNKRDL